MITGLREPMRFRVYHANRGIVNVEGTRGVPPAGPEAGGSQSQAVDAPGLRTARSTFP